jgi:hypothetical protein
MAKKSTDWRAYNPTRLGHCNEEPRIIARTHTHALKKREEGQKEHKLAGLWPNMPGALQ